MFNSLFLGKKKKEKEEKLEKGYSWTDTYVHGQVFLFAQSFHFRSPIILFF